MNCVYDKLIKDFSDIPFCAENYSIGTNLEPEIYLQITEVESGRIQRVLAQNIANRFSIPSSWFTAFNTYLFECLDVDFDPIQWTYEDENFDAYRVKFKIYSGDNCGDSETIINIG